MVYQWILRDAIAEGNWSKVMSFRYSNLKFTAANWSNKWITILCFMFHSHDLSETVYSISDLRLSGSGNFQQPIENDEVLVLSEYFFSFLENNKHMFWLSMTISMNLNHQSAFIKSRKSRTCSFAVSKFEKDLFRIGIAEYSSISTLQ